MVRVSDSESRSWNPTGVDCVFQQDTFTAHRTELWLCPNMTGKLLTGMLNQNMYLIILLRDWMCSVNLYLINLYICNFKEIHV